MDEIEHPDEPLIRDLIQRSRFAPDVIQDQVWEAMAQYRRDVLSEVAKGEDRIERELRACVARGNFRRRLEELLGGGEGRAGGSELPAG
jgi:hypothetical protein